MAGLEVLYTYDKTAWSEDLIKFMTVMKTDLSTSYQNVPAAFRPWVVLMGCMYSSLVLDDIRGYFVHL